MQKEKQISTLVGIIIIVAVVAILFGGVFAYQYFTTKSQQNSNFFASRQKNDQTQNKTTGWKTYKNDEYGFELKYPADFKTTADINPAGYLNLYLGYSNTPYIGDISIIVSKNNNNETAAQYFLREKVNAVQGFASKCQTCANMDVDAELYDCLANRADIIKIAGKDGFLCKNMPQKATFPSPIYVFDNRYIYQFLGYWESNPSYKIYNEILSTFKFTK